MSTLIGKLAIRFVAAGALLAALSVSVRAETPGQAGGATPSGDAQAGAAAAPTAGVAKATGNELPVIYPANVDVTGASVRLRSGPTEQYAIVKVLAKGDVLVATGLDKGWVAVRMPSDAPCWVSSSYVTDLGNGNGKIRGTRVNLRISPNTNHYPVGQVTDKDVRLVLDADGKPRRKDDWVQIVPPAEAKAYVHADLVTKSAVALPAETATVVGAAAGVGEAAKPANAGPTPEDIARERQARLIDEAKAFRELDKLFLEEIGKPADKRDFEEMKLLYSQYSESAEDSNIRTKAVERVKLIEQTEAKIQNMIADAQKRAGDAKAAAEKAEADRLAKIEEIRKSTEAKPEVAVDWLATGYVADHGRDARVPASHALCDADGNVLYYLRWDAGDLATLWQLKVRISGTAQNHAGWDKPVVVVSKCETAK